MKRIRPGIFLKKKKKRKIYEKNKIEESFNQINKFSK